MSLSVETSALDGVDLISPTSARFDDLARPLIGERVAGTALQLKPLAVIVANRTSRTIVSLSLVWRVLDRRGRPHRNWQHASFPEVVCGDARRRHEPGLVPGGLRVEAHGLVIHGWSGAEEYYDQYLGQFVDERNRLLRRARALQIELNAVIFADGTLIGPDDDSMLTDLFSAYVRAKQECYRGLLRAIATGQPLEGAFAAVRALIPQRDWSGPGYEELWPTQALAEAHEWIRAHGRDDPGGLIERNINFDPFVIRRN